jgi:hypothetical protein
VKECISLNLWQITLTSAEKIMPEAGIATDTIESPTRCPSFVEVF